MASLTKLTTQELLEEINRRNLLNKKKSQKELERKQEIEEQNKRKFAEIVNEQGIFKYDDGDSYLSLVNKNPVKLTILPGMVVSVFFETYLNEDDENIDLEVITCKNVTAPPKNSKWRVLFDYLTDENGWPLVDIVNDLIECIENKKGNDPEFYNALCQLKKDANFLYEEAKKLELNL